MCVISLRERVSVKASDIHQEPDHLTFGSRVRSDFVCVNSEQILSMCTIWTNFVCTLLREGLSPNYHHGASRMWQLIQSVT